MVASNPMETSAKPRLSAPLVWGLTLALSLVLLSTHRVSILPRNPDIVPQGWAALPFLVLLALGLAVLIGLAVANRGRFRAVLRPNRGRVVAALAMGFVTPIAVYSWLPWIIGGMWLMLGLPALQEGNPWGFFFGLLMVGLAALVWYPIACLIVSGIHHRAVRVAIFALMFWAAYSAILLLTGTQKFML